MHRTLCRIPCEAVYPYILSFLTSTVDMQNATKTKKNCVKNSWNFPLNNFQFTIINYRIYLKERQIIRCIAAMYLHSTNLTPYMCLVVAVPTVMIYFTTYEQLRDVLHCSYQNSAVADCTPEGATPSWISLTAGRYHHYVEFGCSYISQREILNRSTVKSGVHSVLNTFWKSYLFFPRY